MTTRYARIGDQPELDRPLAEADLFEIQTAAGGSAHVTGATLRELAVMPSSADGRALLTATLEEQKSRLAVPPPLPAMPALGDVLMAAEGGLVQTASLWPYLLSKLNADLTAMMEHANV